MISDLGLYDEWKRNTLNRLTERHRANYMRVIGDSLKRLSSPAHEAVETGEVPVWTDGVRLRQQVQRVLAAHQADTVHVAVSDGIRETSTLASWESFDPGAHVEDTFTDLAELKKRDTFAQRIAKKIRKDNAKRIDGFAKSKAKDYLDFVKKTFRELVEDYHKNEDTDDTADTIKDALQRIYRRSDSAAETMFRTETTRYFNESRLEFFRSGTDVDFIQLVAVTDGRISDICESRDGFVLPIAKAHLGRYHPPFHPNCRTVQSPLDTDLRGDAEVVRRNLGVEFGSLVSKTSGKSFTGRRPKPTTPLPKGWD